jgi:hypothetical protein
MTKKLWIAFLLTAPGLFAATGAAIDHGFLTMVAPPPGGCPSFTGFVFWPGYDSYQFDLGQYTNRDLSSMISSCANNPSCKGLNTVGYYKSYIKPLSKWATWTSSSAPCQGLYIKIPNSFKVNGKTLSEQEVKNLKWIAQYTVPNFGMPRYTAIRDYIAKGTWWALSKQVLNQANPWNTSLCYFSNGYKSIGPLETCNEQFWMVGIAGVQVRRPTTAVVEQRATSVYNQDIPTVLGRSALQASYTKDKPEYTAITQATGDLRKAWLLKSHLVGFYFVATEVNDDCLIQSPRTRCYNAANMYAPNAASIKTGIDEVMVLLQSLTSPGLELKMGDLTIQGESIINNVYWPGTTSSGVTLGIGYDLGSRNKSTIIADLTNAGMRTQQASKIAEAAGLKGSAAGNWVSTNKNLVGSWDEDISRKLFFTISLPKYTAEAKTLATSLTPSPAGDAVNARSHEIRENKPLYTYVMKDDQWNRLHKAMIEFITDLKYQGGYYAYDRIARINRILIANDNNPLAQFKQIATLFGSPPPATGLSYMDDYGKRIGESTGNKEIFYGVSNADISGASTRRNRIRLSFLVTVIKALEAGKAVTIVP